MSCNHPWLPDLLHFQGDWETYVDSVFAVFDQSFIRNKAYYNGQEISLRWNPTYDRKPSAFWHLIQEGYVEEDRTPDLRRCERIAWIRAILENSNDPAVKVWENERSGRGGVQRQILLWLECCNFIVVLGKRSGYLLLLTAYQIKGSSKALKLNEEYRAFHNLPKS
jgi:hypothetical protein